MGDTFQGPKMSAEMRSEMIYKTSEEVSVDPEPEKGLFAWKMLYAERTLQQVFDIDRKIVKCAKQGVLVRQMECFSAPNGGF